MGDLEAKAIFANAADDDDDMMRSGHGISFERGRRVGLAATLAMPTKDASA
jgi:hypothetical protein